MDIEQIIKQVDWLDEERRRDKTKLGSLEERQFTLEENIQPLISQIKDMSGEINRLSTITARMDQYDENLLQQRVETKQYIDEMERQLTKNQEESEKIRTTEIGAIDANIDEIRKEITAISEIKLNLSARIEEESRLSRSIDELRNRVDDIRRSEEEYTRTIRLMDDGRRQDSKRLTDLQGEVTALRKRTDEHQGQIELNGVSSRKLETRINEMVTIESERQQAQETFIEKQSLQQVERDRVWKDWQTRFNLIEQQTVDIESNMQSLEVTHRDVKRTQQTVDELNQLLERRMNEISEIQRLSEERFRQEWVTFKADDQKRWTNYTLTQEEHRGESQRLYEKLSEKVSYMEDSMQEINDLLQQANELTEKRLQTIRALVHDWVTEYERSIGPSR